MSHRIRCLFAVSSLTLLLAFLARSVAAPIGEPAELPKEITNSIGMEFVLIPAGKFVMGSPKSEKERSEDEEQHEVTITKRMRDSRT